MSPVAYCVPVEAVRWAVAAVEAATEHGGALTREELLSLGDFAAGLIAAGGG